MEKTVIYDCPVCGKPLVEENGIYKCRPCNTFFFRREVVPAVEGCEADQEAWVRRTSQAPVFEACKLCKGACCKPDGCFLTRNEAKQIEREMGSCLTTDHGELLKLKSVGGACQFLTPTGCRLKKKPIACVLYPLYPIKNGWAIRMSCPYWRQITDDEIQETIEYFQRNREEWKAK